MRVGKLEIKVREEGRGVSDKDTSHGEDIIDK